MRSRLNAAGQNVLAQRLTDHADEICGLKISLLDTRRQFWIAQPHPPLLGGPPLWAIELEDKRQVCFSG